jgi:hypothetical protein
MLRIEAKELAKMTVNQIKGAIPADLTVDGQPVAELRAYDPDGLKGASAYWTGQRPRRVDGEK